MRASLLRGPPRDLVSTGGDGAKRGGCPRARAAYLAAAAAGGHDHTAVSGLHGLPALREDTPAGELGRGAREKREEKKTD